MRPLVFTRRRFLGAAAVALVTRPAFAARSYQGIFRIERSKNANIVQYDAVLDGPDKLDAKEPVVAYWIQKAEDGRREGLNILDRRAYGFKVTPEKDGSWLLYMNATKQKTIRVVKWQGRWIAEVMLQRKPAVLERMYVSTDESAFIPNVRWIDVFGKDMANGKPLTERLKP
jgi:hypothetical protein